MRAFAYEFLKLLEKEIIRRVETNVLLIQNTISSFFL